MSKRGVDSDATFSDDGFALGLAYLLRVLKQQKLFKLTERVAGDFPHHGDTISSEGRKRLQRHLAHEYALFGELQKLGKPF